MPYYVPPYHHIRYTIVLIAKRINCFEPHIKTLTEQSIPIAVGVSKHRINKILLKRLFMLSDRDIKPDAVIKLDKNSEKPLREPECPA